MSVVSRVHGGLVLTSLLTLLASVEAGEGATPPLPRSGGKPTVTRAAPRIIGHRPVGSMPNAVRPASRQTTEPQGEIVEGGTYQENSQGKLVLSPTPGPTVGPAPGPAVGPVYGHGPACEAGGCHEPMMCDDCGFDPCCCYLPPLRIDNFEFFGGVQGFSGPGNRGSTASFGFHEGFNWGTPSLLFPCWLSTQLGARATQSNLSGSEITEETRHQVFVTGGVFRRVDCGLQGGVVFDYLNDAWYRDISLLNLRGELSWVLDCTNELGCWVSLSRGDETALGELRSQNGTVVPGNLAETWEGTDLYAFFYRRQFGDCSDGETRLFGGFTGNGDGLLGLDARLPLNHVWALEANVAYLIPKEGKGPGIDFNSGHIQESWNLGLSLVWYPGRHGCCGVDPYSRPLFRVADNGTFMVDRK